MISIAIADDEALFRKGLAMLLSSDPRIRIHSESPNGLDLLKAVAGSPPDLVLLDLKMPELDGIQTLRQLRHDCPDVRTIVLTSHYSKAFIANTIRSGASGFLKKDTEPDEMLKVIFEVAEKGYYYDPQTYALIHQSFISGRNNGKTMFAEDHLTTREIEVLKLICQQKTTAGIADELFISPRTVDGHRNNLLLKTGSKNIAGLVLYAIEKGLYEL